MKAEYTGNIHSVSRDFKSKKPIISFLLDQDLSEISEEDTKLVISVKPLKKSRSLDSNAYFHVLCQKIADKMILPLAVVKNEMITSYGQPEMIDDEVIEYVTNAPPNIIEKREEIHMKFIGIAPDLNYRYRVYRGSHTLDTSEMSKLIEGTIQEAKLQGIETATPTEIERMNALWGKRKH